MNPVQLTEEESDALALAIKLENKAQTDAEIVITEAKLPWMKAVRIKNNLLEQLGDKYGFDPSEKLQFDAKNRLIGSANGNGQ